MQIDNRVVERVEFWAGPSAHNQALRCFERFGFQYLLDSVETSLRMLFETKTTQVKML